MSSEGSDRLYFLCHEIGAGHWYGYLWGKYVGQFLHLMNAGCRIASCIHADTLPEMHDILVSRELGVSEEDFSRLNLILFIKMERTTTGYRHRVATLYENSGESRGHSLLFTWEPRSDTFKQHRRFENQVADDLQRCRSFIESLVASGKTHFQCVREQVVKFYSNSLHYRDRA